MIWLIAEDETDIRNLIAMMAQVWGKQARAFENGQKVWEWLDAFEAGVHRDELPELVLMDIRMPGKRGNEIARRMRQMHALERTPIVLMTAFALSEAERHEMMAQDGVDEIIAKPLPDFEQLRVLLHTIVDTRQSQSKAST